MNQSNKIIKKHNKHLHIVLDMSGCPNRCKHCWLGELPNHILTDKDAEDIVNKFKPYFKQITFYSWLREPDFVKDYKTRWEKDITLSTIKPQRFELASFYKIVRDDNYVKWLKSLGTKKVQLTFFGLKDMTDKYVGRVGAFDELMKATEILKENDIEPRWQIFINEENKDEVVELINIAKRKNIKEIIVHEGTCDGNNLLLYNIRINKENIPDEVKEYYLDYPNILSEKECIEILKNEDSNYLLHNDKEIVLNITSDFNVYFNFTNPSPCWKIGNVKKEDIDELVNKIVYEDIEALNLAKTISLKELVRRYGDVSSNKVFSLDDYKMYLLNSFLFDKNKTYKM